jgi:hypothetical protein
MQLTAPLPRATPKKGGRRKLTDEELAEQGRMFAEFNASLGG